MPDVIKKSLEIHPVRWIDEVLEIALEKAPTPLDREPEESQQKEKLLHPVDRKKTDNGGVTTH